MGVPKLIILLAYIGYCVASQHTIPVEGYETELHNLGQHVEIPETPVKIIKITKTIAVKIPVPYPVKVIEKVPYPVHVSKPYPVPVPQIVHVPYPHKHAHDGSSGGLDHGQHSPYQVQESHGASDHNNGFGQSYGGDSEHQLGAGAGGDGHQNEESFGGSYGGPSSYHGYSGGNDGHDSLESKNYDQSFNKYLQNAKPGGYENSGY